MTEAIPAEECLCFLFAVIFVERNRGNPLWF